MCKFPASSLAWVQLSFHEKSFFKQHLSGGKRPEWVSKQSTKKVDKQRERWTQRPILWQGIQRARLGGSGVSVAPGLRYLQRVGNVKCPCIMYFASLSISSVVTRKCSFMDHTYLTTVYYCLYIAIQSVVVYILVECMLRSVYILGEAQE